MKEIIFACIFFAAGVVLVIKGGDWFVDAASVIAKAAKIPPFIIGATIVSFATTLPEMIVSVMASLEGKNDMAVGNAVGSVTANTGLIMALALLFMSVSTPRKQYLKQSLILILSAGLLWAGCLTGSLSLWACIALICAFAVFMALNVVDAKNHPGSEEDDDETYTKKDIIKNILLFIVGAGCIVLGSNFLINGGSKIAEFLGVPERVIAVTMVAVGTSLPELITTLTAIRKKESALSVGNIIGANIIDLSLILPVCSFASGESFAVSSSCLKIDLPACAAISLIAIFPLMLFQRGSKIQGAVMLAAYAAYLAITMI